MKHFLLTLLLATLCATGYGQTIKALGYNTTNGQIVAATNVTWTNSFNFSTNTVAAEVRTNLSLGATWLTNTNVTNFRTDIGLGATNSVSFNDLRIDELIIDGENGISFENEDGKANTRSALGLPLPALTNTSNVTMMRALAGSTNDPVTSVVTFKTPSDDSFDMTFSNGILISVEETP